MRSPAKAAIVASVAVLLLAAIAPLPAAARTAAIPSDFNGDGNVDLAVGVPGESVGGKTQAGAVNVIYGTDTVLKAAGNQLWTQDTPGVRGDARRTRGWLAGNFGSALASGDFNRDGYSDLAIGAPVDRVGKSRVRSGAVNVLYGSRSGLTAKGDQRWTLGKLPGKPADGDLFGRSLSAGDLDGDGAWDLVISAPGRGMGEVVVLWGSRDGLRASDVTTLVAADLGGEIVGGLSGMTAIGDLVGDSHADLAVRGYGVVVIPGAADGLALDQATQWSQDLPGMVPSVGEGYLGTFAIGDYNGDGFGDLAAKGHIPAGCDPGVCNPEVGAIAVIYGSPEGLTTDGNQLLVPPPGWVVEGVDGMPWFGAAIAGGDLDGDGADDLAVGAPGSYGPPVDEQTGVVILFYGNPAGLGAERVERWSQDSAGVPGSSEEGDRFGQDLAIADYGRSSRADLAIGARGEHQGASMAGRVTILLGRAGGLSAKGAQTWSQNTPAVKGRGEYHDRFGAILAP